MNLDVDCTTPVLDSSSPAVQGQWQQAVNTSSNKSPKREKRSENKLQILIVKECQQCDGW